MGLHWMKQSIHTVKALVVPNPTSAALFPEQTHERALLRLRLLADKHFGKRKVRFPETGSDINETRALDRALDGSVVIRKRRCHRTLQNSFSLLWTNISPMPPIEERIDASAIYAP